MWSFDSESESALQGFQSWERWLDLDSLNLHGLPACDTTAILQSAGDRLTSLHLDNFGSGIQIPISIPYLPVHSQAQVVLIRLICY